MKLTEKISGKHSHKIQLKMDYKLDFEKIRQRFENDPEGIKIGFLVEMQKIFRFLENSNEEINRSICNYVVIRTVSAIESFFKHHARMLIDKKDIPASQLFDKKEKIDLKVIDEFKDKKITKGKIIAYGINFQDLDNINNIMSTIFNIKFLDEIKKFSASYTFVGFHETTKLELKELYDLFAIRHEIIHEMSDFEGTYAQLKQYFGQAMIFLAVSDEYTKKK